MGSKSKLFGEICSRKRGVDSEVLEQTIALAVEIAREGREGRKIGTLFVVGDSEEVFRRSKPLILDPLHGHPDESKRITDPDMRETLKGQLQGARTQAAAQAAQEAAAPVPTPSPKPEEK